MAVLGLAAACFVPGLARTQMATYRIYCANNLKQVGTAFNTWAASHGGLYPMMVSLSDGGYQDLVGIRFVTPSQQTSRGVFGNFLSVSNELGSPKVLICPAENRFEPRIMATTFSGSATNAGSIAFTNDLNVSYFMGVDASQTTPGAFLAGDHNLGSDGNLVPLWGFVTFPSTYHPDFKVSLGTNFAANAGVAWQATMHYQQGNVVLADGSVQQYNRDHLQDALARAATPSTKGSKPSFSLPPGCTGVHANEIQFP